ncbi:GAF domain-containing SpoIIE family protein phosphatase [Actinoplanes sp. NPDC049316]|uniref:GAF domain-containing SpoIIE family protein phosphatase n=1 Tax=Actinoplanes sp. NPDC049316 TaxID=3154727 RepID=UPI00344909B5
MLTDPVRLRSLHRSCLAAAPDETFDRIAAMVCRLLGVPVTLVSLVDADRQFFPGAAGLPEPWNTKRETPLSHSICRHVVREGRPRIFRDTRTDPQAGDCLAIPGLAVVAYAGFPLTDVDGQVLGALCAIDDRPREWTPAELAVVADLAVACSSELRVRIACGLADEARVRAEGARTHFAARVRLAERLARADSVPAVLECVVAALVPGTAGWAAAVLVDDPAGIAVRYAGPCPVAAVRRLARTEAEGYAGGSHLTVLTRPADAEAPRGIQVRGADERTAALVRETGCLAYLSVPIVAPATGSVLGVVLAGSGRGWFSGAEAATVVHAGRAAGPAVEGVRLQRRHRHVTEVLQRSLLGTLPVIPGVELHARYLPAGPDTTVGGDWYDAFEQPDGSVMLAVGDVCGHDIEAAAAMGQLRNLVRGNAYGRTDEPGRVLRQVHSAVDGMAVPVMATMLLARLVRDPRGHAVSFASAGHLPPLVVRPGGGVEVWWEQPEPLLGPVPCPQRTTHHRTLPAGSTLLLYTDGLVEEPGRMVDAGIRRVVRLLDANRRLPGDRLCELLLAAAPSRRDDIALLLVRPGPVTSGRGG